MQRLSLDLSAHTSFYYGGTVAKSVTIHTLQRAALHGYEYGGA